MNDSGNVSLALEPGMRSTYALTSIGQPNDLTWTSTQSLQQVSDVPQDFLLNLDAAGNHRPIGAARWYGISGDGNTFLGATPGDDDTGTRGISIGLR